MTELREITPDNYKAVIALSVSEEQAGYVSSNVLSLAQAWAYKKTAYPFAVCADGVPVGFVMLGYYEARGQYTLWKLMVDRNFQGLGYGKAALCLGIRYLADTFGAGEIYTGVAFGNTVAERLYASVGFKRTGLCDETQIEMRLDMKNFSCA